MSEQLSLRHSSEPFYTLPGKASLPENIATSAPERLKAYLKFATNKMKIITVIFGLHAINGCGY